MRLVVLKPDTIQSINAKIAGASSTQASAATLERLRAANPHVDFSQQLTPGAAIFLPDTPDLQEDGSRSLDGGAFDGFATDLDAGLKAAAAHLRKAAAQSSADKADVAGALKTAAMKRLLESDATLKAQLDDANAQFDKDQKQAQDTLKQFDAMQKDAASEMAALGKLFG